MIVVEVTLLNNLIKRKEWVYLLSNHLHMVSWNNHSRFTWNKVKQVFVKTKQRLWRKIKDILLPISARQGPFKITTLYCCFKKECCFQNGFFPRLLIGLWMYSVNWVHVGWRLIFLEFLWFIRHSNNKRIMKNSFVQFSVFFPLSIANTVVVKDGNSRRAFIQYSFFQLSFAKIQTFYQWNQNIKKQNQLWFWR